MNKNVTDRVFPYVVLSAAALFGCAPPPASGAAAQAAAAGGEIQAPAQGAWPKMRQQNGRYFSFVVPEGWRANESTNGVDITSPDGKAGMNFVGLEGSRGSATPKQQIERIAQALRLSNLRFTETKVRPSQHGFDMAEFQISYTDPSGQAFRAWTWSAVNNSYGFNNAYMGLAWAATDRWEADAQFLTAGARLINVINPAQAFQRDQLIRMHASVGPGSAGGFNHPNTFTPYSNQAAMNRISDQRSRTTRDDYPLVDPSTGSTYHGTSANYDYVRGGWVNPHDHTQLLQVVPLGQ